MTAPALRSRALMSIIVLVKCQVVGKSGEWSYLLCGLGKA